MSSFNRTQIYMSTFKCCELQLFTILTNKAPAILNHLVDKMLQEFIVWTSKIINSTKSIVLNAELSGLCLISITYQNCIWFPGFLIRYILDIAVYPFIYNSFWTTRHHNKLQNNEHNIVICNLIIFINIKIPVALSFQNFLLKTNNNMLYWVTTLINYFINGN